MHPMITVKLNSHTGKFFVRPHKYEIFTPRKFPYMRMKLKQNKTLTTLTQPAITCSKLTIEILEQGVKYFQS